MGITGEIVRNVFSRSRSVRTHESNVKSNAYERRRWSSVRAYLCGDEYNSIPAEEDSTSVKSSKSTATQLEFRSVLADEDSASVWSSKATLTLPELSSALAEEDSASIRSSEATVTQPIREDLTELGHVQNKDRKEKLLEEKHNSTGKLFREEDAATVIQTAFRGFLARRRSEIRKLREGKEEIVIGTGSPSRESVGTSVEVQIGNSADVFSSREESTAVPHRIQQRARTQVLKLQEDWDDSTLSSNVLKMRIQNRLEAATRRERALAYAFSQQLRLCSKKKQTRCDGEESNMGRSWLERWMATRQSENSLIENQISKKLEPFNSNQRTMVRKRLLDVAMEEMESCGSNEVSLQIDSTPIAEPTEKGDYRPSKNRFKATRSASKHTMMPSYHRPRKHIKVCKKDSLKEEEKDKKHKVKQPGNKRETKYKDATSQVSPELVKISNSKLGP